MATVRRTHMAQQQMHQKARRQEEAREDTLRILADTRRLEAKLASDERVENKRMIRLGQMIEAEREMDSKLCREEEAKLARETQREQEEKMALEMEKIKLEKLRDEKMRQQIRDNSSELRELEAKLKNAYMNRERDAQIAEKLAHKYDVTARDAEISKIMMEEAERAKEAEAERERELYEATIRYQQELERQLEYKERQKQEAYEELLKDKLMIDEITRKIFEEDERELTRRRSKKAETQQYIDDFMKAREAWKIAERERMEEENRLILKFAQEQKEREDKFMADKMAREGAKAAAQAKLAERIAEEDRLRREMEEIRTELHLEEEEEAQRRREKDDIEKKLRQRIELREVHAKQMHFKAMREQAQKEEDERFRQQMLAKFAEDDRIEQMDAQKRRMKKEQHKRQVEELLRARQEQFAMDKERELEEQRMAKELEEFRKRIIEEERQRLLREHATKLVGYLPKGVFRDEADLSVLPPEHRERYAAQLRSDDDY